MTEQLIVEERQANHAETDRPVMWKNVYFLITGAAVYGSILWPTQQAAERAAQDDLHQLMNGLIDATGYASGPNITKESYSWHMQVPVVE